MGQTPQTARALDAVELCCGLGGIGLGLRELGFRPRRAYDVWDKAVDIYNHNAPEPIAMAGDLLAAEFRSRVAEHARGLRGLDLLAAGPPCKGYSQLKNGRHDARVKVNRTPNRVLAAIPDYVALFEPRLVFLENVPALATHRGGETLRVLLERLRRPSSKLRYRVEHAVFDAAHFGVPQRRKRLLILCVREGDGNERLPAPQPDLGTLFARIRYGKTPPSDVGFFAERLRDPTDIALTTAAQALSDLPSLGPGATAQVAAYRTPATTAFQAWARAKMSDSVDCLRTPAVTPDTLERLRHVAPGQCIRDIPEDDRMGLARMFHSAYRRLHPSAPSTALSTKYDCVYHYLHMRSLSLREYARLQAIPDHFSFPEYLVCRRHAYELIGNSVPPRLVFGVLSAALGLSSREVVR